MIGIDRMNNSSNQTPAQPSEDFLQKYIPIAEFSEAKDTPVEKIIQMIRAGACVGFYKDNAWYVARSELAGFNGNAFFVEREPLKTSEAKAEVKSKTATAENPNPTIFVTLPRGQLGLAVTFWVFAVLGKILIAIFMFGFIQVNEGAMLPLVLAFAVYQYWVLIGVIRSSVLYKGLPLWGALAILIDLAVVGGCSYFLLYILAFFVAS